MSDAQHTKDQHYISQEYLRGFSQDSKTVFEYNLRLDKPIDKPVSIESVCKEKYLYELRDEQGAFIDLNYLEKRFRDIEGDFAKFKRQLLEKAVHKENCAIKCFLSNEEKTFWSYFTTLNMMRNPETLKGIKGLIQEEMHGRVSDQQAQNMALEYNLPFFKLEDFNNPSLFRIFHSLIRQMVLTVAYVESDDLFTSDHAMYGIQNKENGFSIIKRLWFPITSNCGLLFAAPETITGSGRNCLIPLSEDQVRYYNKGIAYIATQYVLSKRPFSESDTALIWEARREKAKEEGV